MKWLLTPVLLAALVVSFFQGGLDDKNYSCGNYPIPERSQVAGYFVQDWAGLLEEESKLKLNAISSRMLKDGHGRLYFVIVHVTDPDNADLFAKKIAEKWDDGNIKARNTVIIMAAKPGNFNSGGDKEFLFGAVSGNMDIGYSDDPQMEEILEHASIPIGNQDWEKAFILMADFIRTYRQDTPSSKDGNPEKSNPFAGQYL